MFKLYSLFLVFAVTGILTLVGCRKEGAGEFALTKVTGTLDSKHYHITNSCSWESGNTRFGAVMEALKNVADSTEPSSRLTIRNLSADTVIYQMDLGGFPNYMQVLNLTPDGSPKLYINHHIAASANAVYIFSVSESNAHLILEQDYTGEEEPLFLYERSSDSVDIFLSDRGPGLEPTQLSRYRWRDGRYSLIGVVPYENIHKLINDQYTDKEASPRKP